MSEGHLEGGGPLVAWVVRMANMSSRMHTWMMFGYHWEKASLGASGHGRAYPWGGVEVLNTGLMLGLHAARQGSGVVAVFNKGPMGRGVIRGSLD